MANISTSKPTNVVAWSSNGQNFSANLPLACTSRTTGQAVRNICIGLHGYGDTAANFAGLSEEIPANDMLWIFPQAPTPVPQSFDGAQWYNLFGPARADVEHSFSKLSELVSIVSKVSGLPHNKIFLMGFSQGAYLTLYSGLRTVPPFAGLVAMSGYVGQTHRMPPLSAEQKAMPVYLAHGLQDQVVLPASHFETLDLLDALGFSRVRSSTFQMGHSAHPQELLEVSQFIEANR